MSVFLTAAITKKTSIAGFDAKTHFYILVQCAANYTYILAAFNDFQSKFSRMAEENSRTFLGFQHFFTVPGLFHTPEGKWSIFQDFKDYFQEVKNLKSASFDRPSP